MKFRQIIDLGKTKYSVVRVEFTTRPRDFINRIDLHLTVFVYVLSYLLRIIGDEFFQQGLGILQGICLSLGVLFLFFSYSVEQKRVAYGGYA